MTKRLWGPAALVIGSGAALLAGTGIAGAQEADEVAAAIEDLTAAIDVAWLLIAGILVLFMQAGFAMVEAGFVRSKNVTNILMKNILDVSLGALAYWAVGFGLAYGISEQTNEVFGLGNFFLNEFDDFPTWFFQFAFAATAATIVSGAMAERTKFHAYLIYTIVITAVIYPVVTHWVWDGAGWLTSFRDDPLGDNIGMVDFAGSTVVHSVGGWAALVGAVMVGARRGKYNADGSVNPIFGHSMPLAMLGVLILWIGWYGFNAGSTLGLSGGFAAVAARVAVTTTLAAGAGASTAMLISWLRSGRPDLSLTLNGVLGGLVGITAGTATVDPWAAVVIGVVAGVIIVFGVELLDRLRIDDPVGAVPVHLFNGIWGTLAVGLFSSQEYLSEAFAPTASYGLLLGGGFELLLLNLLGVVAVGAWTVVASVLLFGLIKYTIGLRVSPEEEESGLDVGEHGTEAYPEFTGGRDPFGQHFDAASRQTARSG
ncbi:MAG: ammonium transporter, partial [Chloroflexi bacterium]|nr:ammonium transporter [Chloroflexota bacterium]